MLLQLFAVHFYQRLILKTKIEKLHSEKSYHQYELIKQRYYHETCSFLHYIFALMFKNRLKICVLQFETVFPTLDASKYFCDIIAYGSPSDIQKLHGMRYCRRSNSSAKFYEYPQLQLSCIHQSYKMEQRQLYKIIIVAIACY